MALFSRVAPLLLFALLAACGGSATTAATPATPGDVPVERSVAPAPAPPVRDAQERLVADLAPNIVATLVLADVKEHPLAPEIAALDAMKQVVAGTGIDPLEEVDQVFIVAKDLLDGRAIAVLAEHHADPAAVEGTLEKLVTASGEEGAWLEGYPFPAAQVQVEGRTSVVMLVRDTLVAVTSPELAPRLEVLDGTGGLAKPTGDAALVADVRQPAENLRARGGPTIPSTLSEAHVELHFLEGGDARLDVDAQSTDENQARLDADRLTKEIDDATSVKVSIIRVRAFDPIVFEADGDRVVAKRRITKKEMSSLLGFAKMLQR